MSMELAMIDTEGGKAIISWDRNRLTGMFANGKVEDLGVCKSGGRAIALIEGWYGEMTTPIAERVWNLTWLPAADDIP